MMGPFIKSKNSTDKMMHYLLIALIPIVLFTEYKNGIVPYIHGKTDFIGMIYPLLFVIVGCLTSYFSEYIYTKITKVESHYSYITGLFIALVLPINTPIEILMVGCVIGNILGKMIYGGFGANIFNPALIGCLFVLTAYSGVIASNGGYFNGYEVDTIASATPLSNVSGLGTYETMVEPYGNLGNFFLGFIPGSNGETCALLCLIGFIFLAWKKVIKVKIPIFYIGTVFIITSFIGFHNNLGIWYPIFQILSGGLMFGSIFMATDPVTSPTTSLGQIIYGIMLGILTVICRYLTPYPEGVLTSILIMNMFVVILDKIGVRDKNYFKKFVISISLCILLLIPVVITVNNSLNEVSDSNFKIISKEKVNDELVYVASYKGFKGNIKAKVKIKNNEVISYEILEISDDYIEIVNKENYIDKLIKTDDLENVDTVSGATRTSTALKNLLINVKKDLIENEG